MISCIIHFICIIFILFKVKQQKYQDIIYSSFVIILCSCPYIIIRYYVIFSSKLHIRFYTGINLILCLPQILTFFIYILRSKYYRKEFQQSWIYRLLCCCCYYNQQRQIQNFEIIHTSLETVMTISSLQDDFIDTELYNKLKLEV